MPACHQCPLQCFFFVSNCAQQSLSPGCCVPAVPSVTNTCGGALPSLLFEQVCVSCCCQVVVTHTHTPGGAHSCEGSGDLWQACGGGEVESWVEEERVAVIAVMIMIVATVD